MFWIEPRVGTMGNVVSKTQQRLVTGSLLLVAAGAMALGVLYQGERLPEGPNIVGAPSGESETASPTTATINPIEGFLPRSGEGSACREPVGVDLVEGFGATLTINGVSIAPEQMNVVLGPDGEPTNVVTASRALGQYTFGPEPDCPNGSVIRATSNVMQACVYRLSEGPGACVVTEFSFDAL